MSKDFQVCATSGLSRKEIERLDRLSARCDILRERVRAKLNPSAVHHQMELTALEWAIKKIESFARSESGLIDKLVVALDYWLPDESYMDEHYPRTDEACRKHWDRWYEHNDLCRALKNAAPQGSPADTNSGSRDQGRAPEVAAPAVAAPLVSGDLATQREIHDRTQSAAARMPDRDLLDMADSLDMIAAEYKVAGWDRGLMQRAAAQIRKDAEPSAASSARHTASECRMPEVTELRDDHSELLAIHQAVMNPMDVVIRATDTITVRKVKEFILRAHGEPKVITNPPKAWTP